jgi:hypothetical protein
MGRKITCFIEICKCLEGVLYSLIINEISSPIMSITDPVIVAMNKYGLPFWGDFSEQLTSWLDVRKRVG